MNICIFAASSSKIDKVYLDAASRLGEIIASEGHNIVYGGGDIGLMGALADAALKKGSKITGVIPSFMHENGWEHNGIDDIIITEDMGSRKKKMFEMSDAIIALPGGIGTIEELTEAIALKQLDLFRGALVILNTEEFYSPFIRFLEDIIDKGFMRNVHKRIWTVADNPAKAMEAIRKYRDWHDDPVSIARI
ncbi:MAG TPA: TIGR00730 family Rossman fold protein [Bacteroidales bacterium]|nr:TIGR00730 family Rossman fold protein [Bacteroidales bacterium]